MAGGAAQVYERQLVPVIFAPWAPRVLELAAPAADERVLDAACGTGVVARLAAERVGVDGRVVGFDLNPGMPTVARTLPVAGAPIGWVGGNRFGPRDDQVLVPAHPSASTRPAS